MGKFKVALQLYSVRDEMEKDMDKALERVKEMGYDYVEFAGYFGKTADEVKNLLEKHKLECASVHQVYDIFLDKPQESVEYLRKLGTKYCATPGVTKEYHKGTLNFENTVKNFIEVGKLLKASGITLLYHNHDFEFEKFEDKFLLDWLYETIPSEILQTEIDTCWVCYAGYDPAEYIRKYTGRSPVVHLKDFTCDALAAGAVYSLIDVEGKETKKQSTQERGFKFKPLGEGIQNFAEILKAAEDAGAEIVVVEQDNSPDIPPMESVKISREYLKKLGY